VSAAARLAGLAVTLPTGSWMFTFDECCLLSGRGLCDGPIPRPEKSYRVCVSVRASVRVCVCACARVHVCACVCVIDCYKVQQ